jgi:mRNA interferase RelE/StbE
MPTLRIRGEAFRVLEGLSADVRGRILWKALQLAEDTRRQHANVKRLKGIEAMRLRVGDWRIIYVPIEDGIDVMTIGPRGSVYE